MEMTNIVMRHGAIVMIDILGFRRFWRRFSPSEVASSLEASREQV
jgi:hypothetical protein